jgi:molybdopterin synthase catalytic subunit
VKDLAHDNSLDRSFAVWAFWANNDPVGDIRLVEVGESPLDVSALAALVADERAGAVVSFSGNVRDHDHGRDVVSLTYEGHPSAEAVLKDVAAEIDAQFDVIALAVAHRVGALAIGDAALVAVVATAHRDEAFRACSALVDLTKEKLPVWKHQVFADGTDEWVNCA